MNVKFHKITSSYERETEIYLCFDNYFEILTFIFSDSQEKFSLVLLQMTNYIFRP